MYTCVTISVYVLGLQQIVFFGIWILLLTNKYLNICLLSEKCCHNLFLVKYQTLALHFALTNCYTCLHQQRKFLKLSIQYSTGVSEPGNLEQKMFPIAILLEL